MGNRLTSIVTLWLAIQLTGCASRESRQPEIAPPPAAVEDGSSFETAIAITAPNEEIGVNDENLYLAQQFPGYKLAGQALEQSRNRSYDVMTISKPGEDTKTVYFDITGFFGKNQ